MKRLGLFGGTFDPIHNGHMNIAYEALYKLSLHEVIFIPTGNPPHKVSSLITDSEIRYNMVKAAIKPEESFFVSDYEIRKTTRSYTCETIEHFKNIEKNTELFLIIGADCFFDLEKWRNASYILKECTLVVFGRDDENLQKLEEQQKYIIEKYKNKVILLDTPILEISSTLIRNKVSKNESVNYLVPCGVNEIIQHRELYKQTSNLQVKF